jgi:hypothetical protein
MNLEFTLQSAKYLFRFEDATPDELQVWSLLHKVDDPHEFFLPFIGESSLYLNDEVGTQELRVRYWTWTHDGTVDNILDMNYWPGDNEHGIITIKNNMTWEILTGNDNSMLDTEHEAFKLRLPFFEAMRNTQKVSDVEDDHALKDDLILYLNSEAGKQARIIQKTAWNKYCDAMDAITNEHHRLSTCYRDEFELCDKKYHPSKKFLESIGFIEILKNKPWVSTNNLEVLYQAYIWYDHGVIIIHIQDDLIEYVFIKGGPLLFENWYVINEYHDLKERIHSLQQLTSEVHIKAPTPPKKKPVLNVTVYDKNKYLDTNSRFILADDNGVFNIIGKLVDKVIVPLNDDDRLEAMFMGVPCK